MKRLLLILLILVSFNQVKATHLMGGEVTWKCIKSGTSTGYYVFSVKIYRDCQGVPLANVNNKSLVVHNHPLLSSIPLNYLGSNDMSPICNTVNGPNSPFSCGGSNIGSASSIDGAVEEHLFESDPIILAGTPDSNGWHFTYTDIARNLAIINLNNNTGQYGFTLRAVMYPYLDSTGTLLPNNDACYDSSPKFYEKPRTILEKDNGYDPLSFSNGFTYSHNAFDEEQDSLDYSWGQPLDGYNDPMSGYNAPAYDYLNADVTNAIPFATGFSVNSPINGIFMNAQTGRTYYPANIQGNYVTCTNVSAYKCGQKVAEIFREIQVVLVAPTCNLGDTTNGNIGADTLCNVRPIVQPPFFYPGSPAPFQWDTAVHCGDTVAFEFLANDYDYYPNGSRQDLKFEVSGGQFYDYNTNSPCQNPPCATFEELSTGATPPFITSGGTGTGYFEWITSCNHVINSCVGGLKPSIYTFVIKVQDDFCPAPAIENTSQVISVTVYPPCGNIKANEIVTAESSCGAGDGSITVNPNGGFAPYTSYFFDMNGMPVNPSMLTAGDYQVRITDISMCELVDTITISGPPSYNFSLTVSSPVCNGGFDGSVIASVIGGTSPISYLWSTGDTSQMISNLSAGQYSIIITDANNCIQYDTVVLTEPSEIVNDSNLTVITNINCNGDSTGMINISPLGGVPPYSFVWSNGSTNEDLNNLSAGIYNVTIIDSLQCNSSLYSFVLNEPSAINVNSITNPISCNGLSDGSIDISTSGGVGNYTYLWSNGDTTEDISGLSAGNYIIQVIDSSNCIYTDSINIYEPAVLQASLSNNGTGLTSLATGGTSPYDYQVTGPGSFYASSLGNSGVSFTTTPLISGTYTFTVIDANGCIDSTDIIFSVDSNFSPTVMISLSNLVCNSLSDLTIEVSQDSGEVDISTGLIVSNAGAFDISNMSYGDTIGTAMLMAGGGSIVLNTYIMVSLVVNANQAVVVACDSVSGCVGSFTISNMLNGGIDILTNSVPDGNNYTQGNMSSITFDNCFINPCGPLTFSTTINSELGDVDFQTFNFMLTSIVEDKIDFYSIYPNPTDGKIVINFYNIQKEANIIVTDILARDIYFQETFTNTKREIIYLDNLARGAYVITIKTSQNNFSKLIMIR